jgi:DUF4097 and DUF4098 domain-containing protein YvlB
MRYKWLVAGGLVLALSTLCAGIVAILWFSAARLSASGVNWRVFSADSVSAGADEEQHFTVSRPAVLSVENAAGDVTVTGGEGDEIVVAVHKTAWGPTQAEAEAALAALKVTITQNGNAVTVRVEQPEKIVIAGSSRSDTVDFTITVPSETAVSASTNFGDATLSGTTGKADLKTSFGAVNAQDVKGSVTAESSSGAIEAKRVGAEGQTLKLETSFGKIVLEDAVAAEASLNSDSGEIELTRVEATGAVSAKSNFGAVTLEQVAAETYDLDTNSGKITVHGAHGAVKAHTDFGDVEVTEATDADLDLSSNSGSIHFSGSLGNGPHTLTTGFGGIQLSLPDGAALTFDLKTGFGKIKSAFPITTSGDLENDHWRGTINGGGASLTAQTNSGDISLEVLNP